MVALAERLLHHEASCKICHGWQVLTILFSLVGGLSLTVLFKQVLENHHVGNQHLTAQGSYIGMALQCVWPSLKARQSLRPARFRIARITGSVATYAAYPSPRFDAFSETLIGPWSTPKGDMQSVEEVMRSCGGAVQGVRERAITRDDSSDDGSVFLNRADDGFVFLNHGLYTLGPVDWNNNGFFVANFMFGKSRVVLTAWIGNTTILKSSHMLLTRGSFDEGTVPQEEILHLIQLEAYPVTKSLKLHTQVRGSMPSLGQPWILQRVRWERQIRETEGGLPDYVPVGSSIKYWMMTQSPSDFQAWADCSINGNSDIADGRVVSMGALCETTGLVQISARHYNNRDLLMSVIFLEGRIAA